MAVAISPQALSILVAVLVVLLTAGVYKNKHVLALFAVADNFLIKSKMLGFFSADLLLASKTWSQIWNSDGWSQRQRQDAPVQPHRAQHVCGHLHLGEGKCRRFGLLQGEILFELFFL